MQDQITSSGGSPPGTNPPEGLSPPPEQVAESAWDPTTQPRLDHRVELARPSRKDQANGAGTSACRLTEAEIRRREIARFYGE